MIRPPPRSTLFPYNDALPIFLKAVSADLGVERGDVDGGEARPLQDAAHTLVVGEGERAGGCRIRQRRRRELAGGGGQRSEEHTSELQSRRDLVCRLLLEKKKK